MVYATAVPMLPVDAKQAVRNKYVRPQNNVFALAIGGVQGMAILAIGPITGAALNPWRVIGPAMMTGELFTSHMWYGFVYYLICPLAGVIMGGVAYLVFMQDEVSMLDNEENQIADEDVN